MRSNYEQIDRDSLIKDRWYMIIIGNDPVDRRYAIYGQFVRRALNGALFKNVYQDGFITGSTLYLWEKSSEENLFYDVNFYMFFEDPQKMYLLAEERMNNVFKGTTLKAQIYETQWEKTH